MPLPETISVRYTDEEAGYVTVRPIVRQTFSLDELLDMILERRGKGFDARPATPAFRHGCLSFLPLHVDRI